MDLRRRAARLPTQTRRELTVLVARRNRLQSIEVRAAIAQAQIGDLIEALLDQANEAGDRQAESARWTQ